MLDFGNKFVCIIKDLKTKYKSSQQLIGVFAKANAYTSNIDDRVDYDDMIVRQFITNFGVIDNSNLEKNVADTVNNFGEELLNILNDCVNALNCEIDPDLVDQSKKHSVLVFEILIARIIVSLGDNYSGSNYREFIEYLKKNGIYGGIFKKEALEFFSKRDKCKEIFEFLASFKNKRNKELENNYNFPNNSTKGEPTQNTVQRRINIVVDNSNKNDSDNFQDHENNEAKKVERNEKTTPKKKIKSNSVAIKFSFNVLKQDDLELFNLHGLKILCDRLGIENLPKKLTRKDYEDLILNYSYNQENYMI